MYFIIVNTYRAVRQLERFFLGLELDKSKTSDIKDMEQITTIIYHPDNEEIDYIYNN